MPLATCETHIKFFPNLTQRRALDRAGVTSTPDVAITVGQLLDRISTLDDRIHDTPIRFTTKLIHLRTARAILQSHIFRQTGQTLESFGYTGAVTLHTCPICCGERQLGGLDRNGKFKNSPCKTCRATRKVTATTLNAFRSKQYKA